MSENLITASNIYPDSWWYDYRKKKSNLYILSHFQQLLCFCSVHILIYQTATRRKGLQVSAFCRSLQTVYKTQTQSWSEPLLGRHLQPAKLHSSLKNTNIVSELDLSSGQMNSNADRKVNRLQTLVRTVAARVEDNVTSCMLCTYSLRHGLKRVCERPTCSSLLCLRSTKPNNYAQKSSAGFGLPLKSRRKKGSMQYFYESHDERRNNETGDLKRRGDVGGHD